MIALEKLAKYKGIIKPSLVFTGVVFTLIFTLKNLYFYTWEQKGETILYSIPMVFLFFLWLNAKLDEPNFFNREVIIVEVLMLLLVTVRMFDLLFHSGHVLFLIYTWFTTESKIYRIACIPMLLLTGYYKFFVWADFLTPIVGLLIAIILTSIRKMVIARINHQSDEQI